jgi:hypothetical protein
MNVMAGSSPIAPAIINANIVIPAKAGIPIEQYWMPDRACPVPDTASGMTNVNMLICRRNNVPDAGTV